MDHVQFALGMDWIELTSAVGALYLYLLVLGKRRNGAEPPPSAVRILAFYCGLGLVLVAFVSPLDSYDNFSFFAHSTQHMLLMFGAAPLVALGAPLTVVLRASTPRFRDRFILPVVHSAPVKALAHPLVAWLVFAITQTLFQVTPFFNAALNSGNLHVLEHAMYLVTGFFFWWPILGVDSSPRVVTYRARMAALALAVPLEAALGVFLLVSNAPLYAHYVALSAPWGGRAAALLSQRKAGWTLLIGGMLGAAVPAVFLLSKRRATGSLPSESL